MVEHGGDDPEATAERGAAATRSRLTVADRAQAVAKFWPSWAHADADADAGAGKLHKRGRGPEGERDDPIMSARLARLTRLTEIQQRLECLDTKGHETGG